MLMVDVIAGDVEEFTTLDPDILRGVKPSYVGSIQLRKRDFDT